MIDEAALSDAVTAPVSLLVNALLMWASWSASRRLFTRDRWFQHIGHSCLIGYAAVVFVGTLIGSVGLLVPWVYLALVSLVSFGVMIFLKHSAKHNEIRADATRLAARLPLRFKGLADWLTVVVWGSVASSWVCHAVIYGVCRFPQEWDTLMYHLPFVDHWLQKRNLHTPSCHLWSNPANNELVTLWVVGPFTGDFLYNLANLPATVLLACGALEIGLRSGLSIVFRHLAALVIVTQHITQAQLQGAGNDIAAAGLFLCSLGYALRYIARSCQTDLVMCVVALGLLAGTKYYALGYALITILIIAYLVTLKFGWRNTVKTSVYGMAGLSVFGGYWYLRNLLATGSPLYPFGARTDGDSLDNVYPAVWQSTFIGNRSPERFDLASTAIWDAAGPVHWIAALALPITVTWVLLSARTCRHKCRGASRTRTALAVSTIAAVGVWIITPFAVESYPGTLNQLRYKYCPVRYGLCPLSLCVLLLCLSANDLACRVRWAIASVLPAYLRDRIVRLSTGPIELSIMTLFVYQLDKQNTHNISDALLINMAGAWDTLLVGNTVFLVMMLAVIMVSSVKKISLFYWILVVVCIGTILSYTFLVFHQSVRWHRGYTMYYDRILGKGLFRELTNNINAGDTVCVMEERCYPYFGSSRQYFVVQPSPTQNEREWHIALNDYTNKIIIINDDVKFKWEQIIDFIRRNPDLFRKMFEYDNITVYIVHGR